MVTMFKPKPQLLRAVDKPENVSSQEIAKARPVYIDGLPEGGGGPITSDAITIEGTSNSELDGMLLSNLLAQLVLGFDMLTARVLALEEAQAG